ncbi:MAG: hypothetical protein ACR2LX_00955 [Jatrophihabitans sp.]
MTALAVARTCYDHLAGRRGVELRDRLLAAGALHTADDRDHTLCTAVIIASTTFSTAYNWDQTLPIVALVAAMLLTVIISRHAQRLGKARQAAAPAGR